MAEIGTNNSTAWVTLATTDGYAIGALVLAHSLRRVQTKHKLHVLYSAGVSPALSAQLREVFDESTEVDVLDSGDAENLALIGRPDLGVTFTKLYCWRLTQYSKVVFLDADTFVVQNCDELFDRPEISAAPDIGWPDLFNTGVFVLVPSLETYRKLMQFAISHGSFDGGDQGLLNAYFSDWRESDASHRLSFVYNVTAAAIYSYAAAMKKFAPQIKIIHFLGKQKPWLIHYEGVTEGMTFVSEYHQQWHDLYVKMVKEHAPQSSLSTLSLSVSRSSDYDLQQPSSSSLNQPVNCPFTLGDSIDMFQYQYRQCVRLPSHESETQLSVEVETPTQEEVPQSGESPSSSGQPKVAGRYDAWEAGRPDYLGADSFENIQKAMDKSLE